MSKILITGTAGFIGFHLARRLLSEGNEVIGIDNLNAYYDPQLKEARLKILENYKGFKFNRINLEENSVVNRIFRSESPETVVHLAAQAGVRYSLQNPQAYVDSNLHGFLSILEACRHNNVAHLIFASSSSVYGSNTAMPFSVHDNVDHPLSLYAATKKANELMAHAYAHLYNLPCTGLRFFTVYGPWGRPDMAMFIFTRAILNNEPLQIYNYGKMKRDFTYIDDIVESIVRLQSHPAGPSDKWNSMHPDPGTSRAPYRIFNIGNSNPVPLLSMVSAIEKALGKEAQKVLVPMQPGDVPETYADVKALEDLIQFRPRTTVEDGVKAFVEWYIDYYDIV